MLNINPNSLIKTLLQKKIDINELEQEIETLKDSLSQVDPFLLVEIQTKLSNGKDLQNRVAEFLDTATMTTNLSADNLMMASDSIQEASKLKIDFPELKQLEILTKISAWLTKVYIALKPTTSDGFYILILFLSFLFEFIIYFNLFILNFEFNGNNFPCERKPNNFLQ